MNTPRPSQHAGPGLTPGASPGNTKLRTASTVLALAAIFTATLYNAGGELPSGWRFELVEGDEGIAEVLQNVILFIPLGLTLALGKTRALRCIAAGALLSLAVEFTQQWIPGRDPSAGDLVFNSLGTALGVLLVRTAPRWLFPATPRAAWLSLGSAALALTVWLGTGWLLEPMLPGANAIEIRTPDLGRHWDVYAGRVLSVTGRLGVAEPLRVVAIAGAPTEHLAPLLVVDDRPGPPGSLLGADRGDLVLRNRSRSMLLGLDRPDLRARGALAGVAPGDTFTIAVWTDGNGSAFCLARDEERHPLGRSPLGRSCGLGYTVGDGWRLIFYPQHFPPAALNLLNGLWALGWCLGLGWWGRRHIATGVGLGLVGFALIVGPGLVGLLATPLGEIAGAVGGVGIGWWARRRYRVLKDSTPTVPGSTSRPGPLSPSW
jgi:hypothetical protein